MKLGSVFKAIVVMTLLLLSAHTGQALDEVNYRSLIEKEKLIFGEKVQYLIIVNYGSQTMVPAITPPSFVQFNVLNEKQRTKEVSEGQERYKELKRVWLLEPAETGRLSIASAIITYQDPTSGLLKNGKTDVLFVEVEPTEVYYKQQKEKADAEAEKNTVGSKGKGLSIGWLISVVAVVLTALAIWLGTRKPSPAKIIHEDKALQELQAAIAHAEQEDLEQYYAAISRALLDYLQNKFKLDAHVMNTAVLIEKLTSFGISKANLEALEEVFKVADKAKFAGYVPDEDKMIELHKIVENFIEAGRKIKIKPPKEKKKDKDDD